MKRGKKGIINSTLAYWFLALLVLALIVIGYLILSGKGGAAIDAIKNIFRFKG